MISRGINVSDLSTMVDIEISNFVEPWDYKMLYYETQVNPNSEFFCIVDSEDQIMGYVGLWIVKDTLDITNVSVSNEYKRQGVGTALLDLVYNRALEIDAKLISLEVNVNNEKAINMYKKNGYKEVRRIKNYYSKLKEDAYLMQKEVKHG